MAIGKAPTSSERYEVRIQLAHLLLRSQRLQWRRETGLGHRRMAGSEDRLLSPPYCVRSDGLYFQSDTCTSRQAWNHPPVARAERLYGPRRVLRRTPVLQ